MTLPDKPLVPPPPVLGGQESDASQPDPTSVSHAEPAGAENDAEAVDANATDDPESEGEDFGSLIDVLHAQLGRTPDVPAPIAASRRKGALPPPKAEATRASYSSARAGGKPPPAPGVNALPSGVRPPGAPDAIGPDDTGVLIASAVAALTSEPSVDAAAEAGLEGAGADAEAAVSSAASTSAGTSAGKGSVAAVASTETPSASAAGSGSNRAMWVGAAAVLGVAAVWWLWPSPQDASHPADSVTRAAVAHVEDADQTAAETAAKTQRPAADALAKLDLPAEANIDDPRLDAGALAEAEPESAPTGGQAAGDEAPDVEGDIEVDDDVPAQDPTQDSAASTDAPSDPDTKPRARKKKKKSKTPAAAPTASAPSANAAPEKDGATLLADAKAALTAGKLQNAYRLASQARSKGQRAGTLVIMAKAACRMGSESKAKKAFGKMSISERRGIRSECRAKGIRLGL